MTRVEDALAQYRELGFASLGVVIDPDRLVRLRARLDDIMLGRVDPSQFFYQHDSESNRYADLAYRAGWVGPSLRYRKIEKLERDPEFLALIRSPVFEEVARRVLGDHVAIYRSTCFNKAADGSSEIPWHQDAGSYWGLDRIPELQIWTALDDVPEESGCLEFVPASHIAGLATPLGGAIPANVVEANANVRSSQRHPAKAGEVFLIHNCVWHRSGNNRSGRQRRAFTVCFIEGATRCLRQKRAPRQFFTVFGGR